MAVNLHEICRLCLEEIKSPCATLREGSSLLTRLRKFLPILKIHPGDGLPTLVCEQCENLVNICYNFKIQVECSDSALQKYCATQQAQFLMKNEEEISPLNMAGCSYQKSVEHAVAFPMTEEQQSSREESQGNVNLLPNSGLHSCNCVKYKGHDFLELHRSKVGMIEKPYVCAYCGQSFRYMSSLTRHLVIHSGEKRYVCHICSKAFTQEAHLKTHSVLHTGEKPFSCTVCPMAFSRKGNLKRHLQVHRGDTGINK